MTAQRQTTTKQEIKLALAKLLKEKNFEEISVTMICRTAGINRGTFYLHYEDKYDMMNKLKADTFGQIYGIITEDIRAFSREVILAALEFIYQDFAFISVLSQSPYVNLPASIQEFIQLILDNVPDFNQIISQRFHLPEKYAKISYIASIEAIISQWIADGAKESPEEMADIIYQMAS